MAFGRRSSIALLALCAACGVSGVPVEGDSPGHCRDGAPSGALRIMRRDSADAEQLCQAHGVSPTQTSTVTEEPTVWVGKKATITSTVHAAPTITMTIAKDYITTVTVSSACGNQIHMTDAENGEKRDTRLGEQLARFASRDVKRACNCFVADKTATETVTRATITETRPTITQAYTVMDGDPAVSFVTMGATRTVYKTACV